MMRVLVTGAHGFAGRHLSRFLRDCGDTVLDADGVDVRMPDAVRDTIRRSEPDAIVHLAGFSSVAASHRQPAEAYAVNTLGTVNVLAAVRDVCPNVRVLLASSGEVYGRLRPPEPASESMPASPRSPYAASKEAAEHAALQFERAAAVAVIRARPFNHIGVGQSGTFVVPSFAAQVAAVASRRATTIRVGELSTVRDFTHVEDVVRAYRVLIGRGEPGEAYNICSGRGVSLGTILETLLRLGRVEADIEVSPDLLRPADVPWLVGSPSKLEALGWKPEHPVEHALRDVLEEAKQRFREHG